MGCRGVRSPLSRAAETAAVIADGLGLPEPALVRRSPNARYGALEGLTTPSVRGCAGRRPTSAGSSRAASVAARAVAGSSGSPTTHLGRSVVAVTHGGVIQAVLLHLGLPRPGSGAIANGSVHELRVTGERVSFVWSEAYDDAEPTGTG